MKLLLDVHHSPRVAELLRDRGYDVVAAATAVELRELADDELLRVAAAAGRLLVTEDVRDFTRLARLWEQRGEHHAGIVLTPAHRYHRGAKTYRATLVRALTKFLDDEPVKGMDGIWWL